MKKMILGAALLLAIGGTAMAQTTQPKTPASQEKKVVKHHHKHHKKMHPKPAPGTK